MAWAVDAVCWIAGTVSLLRALFQGFYSDVLLALLWIWLYPLLLEALDYLMALLTSHPRMPLAPTSRFVYHPNYNFALCGLQDSHPFDCHRYAWVYQRLLEQGVLQAGEEVRPNPVSRALLRKKMSPMYLLQLNYGPVVARILQKPSWLLPSWLYRWGVLQPMLLATGGSILGAWVALRLGWAVNLGGGYHHASFGGGACFSVYPDISLVVEFLQSQAGQQRVMIIDLDAHQGNGFEKDCLNNELVFIVDAYNQQAMPVDTESLDAITKRLPLRRGTSDAEYLRMVDSIEQDMDNCAPDFVIFNAGTDVLQGDPLGGLAFSRQTVILRDEKVVGMCRRRAIPVLMLLSGGYQQIAAEVVAASISNLAKKFV